MLEKLTDLNELDQKHFADTFYGTIITSDDYDFSLRGMIIVVIILNHNLEKDLNSIRKLCSYLNIDNYRLVEQRKKQRYVYADLQFTLQMDLASLLADEILKDDDNWNYFIELYSKLYPGAVKLYNNVENKRIDLIHLFGKLREPCEQLFFVILIIKGKRNLIEKYPELNTIVRYEIKTIREHSFIFENGKSFYSDLKDEGISCFLFCVSRSVKQSSTKKTGFWKCC